MIRRPPRSTRTDTLFPYTTLFRSHVVSYVTPDGLRMICVFEAPDCEAVRQAARQLGYHYRSEEHTSELQSLMRTSYAVFCLKKKITRSQVYTPFTTYTFIRLYHIEHKTHIYKIRS